MLLSSAEGDTYRPVAGCCEYRGEPAQSVGWGLPVLVQWMFQCPPLKEV